VKYDHYKKGIFKINLLLFLKPWFNIQLKINGMQIGGKGIEILLMKMMMVNYFLILKNTHLHQ